MEYNFIYENKKYDLKKITLSVEEEINEIDRMRANKNYSAREFINAILTFIDNVVNDNAVSEMLGTDDVEEVDTMEVRFIYDKIKNAYQEKNLKEQTKTLKKVAAEINNSVNMANIKELNTISANR